MSRISLEAKLKDIQRFYAILDQLEQRVGGKRTLANCDGRMDWPERGVYFFFEPGEIRSTSGIGMKVVRVGTHALKSGSKTTLWQRLSQHQGIQKSGGGNHRGSVFRHHVGTALIARDGWTDTAARSWTLDISAPRSILIAEEPLERAVSQHIRSMPFLWIGIEDEPGPNSHRGWIERNAIALLSSYNFPKEPIDPPSDKWLGLWAASKEIQRSGLWNVNHITEGYQPKFLDLLQTHVSKMHVK